MSILTPTAVVEAIVNDPDALALLRGVLGPERATADRQLSPYMNADEAAEYLRLPRGVRRLYELVADGTLSRHGTRGHLLVLREEVEALASGAR
jgi:excisionase family DNA binding protein